MKKDNWSIENSYRKLEEFETYHSMMNSNEQQKACALVQKLWMYGDYISEEFKFELQKEIDRMLEDFRENYEFVEEKVPISVDLEFKTYTVLKHKSEL